VSKSNKCSLVMSLNESQVDVHFTFNKGYESTWDEPGCDDEAEIYEVWYPVNEKHQVDVLPIISEDDLEDLYNYIYSYKGEDDED